MHRVKVRGTAGPLCITIPRCHSRELFMVRVRLTAGSLCITISRCHSRELSMHRVGIRVRITVGSLLWHIEHSAYRHRDITGKLHIGPYLPLLHPGVHHVHPSSPIPNAGPRPPWNTKDAKLKSSLLRTQGYEKSPLLSLEQTRRKLPMLHCCQKYLLLLLLLLLLNRLTVFTVHSLCFSTLLQLNVIKKKLKTTHTHTHTHKNDLITCVSP